jgi:hypothetical protein
VLQIFTRPDRATAEQATVTVVPGRSQPGRYRVPLILFRLLRRFAGVRAWVAPVVVIAFVFVTSWPLMAFAEPAGSAITAPGN